MEYTRLLVMALYMCVTLHEQLVVEGKQVRIELDDTMWNQIRQEIRSVLMNESKNDGDYVSKETFLEMRNDLDNLKQTIGELQEENVQLNQAFRKEKRLNGRLRRRMSSNEGRTAALHQDIERNVTSMQLQAVTKYEEYDENIKRFQDDLEIVNQRIAEMTDDIHRVTDNVQDIIGDPGDNKKTSASLLKDINKGNGDVNNVNGDLVDLKENITKLNTYILTVNANLQQLNETVQLGCKEMEKESTLNDCRDTPTSGVYDVSVASMNRSVSVYCDQKTGDGGWLVILRRKDGSENFTRSWEEYKNGFGNPKKEFWAGNELLHHLTKSDQVQLRVDLMDSDGNTAFASYDTFQVLSENDKYKLQVARYRGTAGDSLGNARSSIWIHNGQQFSTYDADNDQWRRDNCAESYKGGWWFNSCLSSHLTGLHLYSSSRPKKNGIIWDAWKGFNVRLTFVEMKIRKVYE